jgi:hypothetical protein
MRTCACPSPPAAGNLNDLYRFSAAANTWTTLSPSGSGPSPRREVGSAATPDGMFYVFGGFDTGVKRVGWVLGAQMGLVAWDTVM